MADDEQAGDKIEPSKVLVVDDDPDLRDLVQLSLSDEGLSVHLAKSGWEALELVDLLCPDLIISDVLMPGMDGWALVRALRSRPTTALTPVLLMTALSGHEDRLRGFRLGADDYLPKPFNPRELVLRVRRVLQSPPELRAAPQSDLHGHLDQIGLSSVLTLLDNERKSGTLTLRTDDGRCRVVLARGRVCEAEGEAGARDEEAMYQALTWPRGEFRFQEHTVETDRPGVGSTALLLEAARRADELCHLEDPMLEPTR